MLFVCSNKPSVGMILFSGVLSNSKMQNGNLFPFDHWLGFCFKPAETDDGANPEVVPWMAKT